MMVLIDTAIWSVALRRKAQDLSAEQEKIKAVLVELIREGRAQLIGAIRQEVLSGIREEAQFQRLRLLLRDYDDVLLTRDDYEEAANLSNRCRAAGVAGSPVDFLLCASAIRRNWQVFTTDKDFTTFAKIIPLDLLVF